MHEGTWNSGRPSTASNRGASCAAGGAPGRDGAAVSQMIASLIAGRYRAVARVAGGGRGRVWGRREELLGRGAAVTELVLPEGLTEAEQEDLRVRVIRKARASAR